MVLALAGTPFPDFITSARRELMLSAVFLAFLGAMVSADRLRFGERLLMMETPA